MLREILVSFGVEVDQSQIVDAQKSVNGLVVKLNQLQRIAGFAVAALGIGSIIEASDQYTMLANRLRAVTDSTNEFIAAEKGVFDIARATFAPVDAVSELFQRFSLVTGDLGKTQEEVLNFTSQITMAMRLGGSSASEARGALIQFGQGLANNFKSGGQELNSIIEQAPELANILARAAGGTIGELKKLAKEGKLTTQVIFDALNKEQPEIERKFAERAKTFEDLRVAFSNEWIQFMKELEPVKKRVLDLMLKLVRATKEWVERGEAWNSFIALAIVGLGTLTVVMGSLAASVIATVAPFAALFILVEDFVGFMRGDDSLIGRWLGEADSFALRQMIQTWLTDFQEFANKLSDPKFWRGIGEAINAAIREALGETISNILGIRDAKKWRLAQEQANPNQDTVPLPPGMDAPTNTGGAGVGPQRVVSGSEQDSEAHPFKMWFARLFASQETLDWIERRNAEHTARANGTTTSEMDATAQLPTFPAGMGPITPRLTGGAADAFRGLVPPAPTIENNITVQGTATSAVAREIANRVGDATAASLGRDRGAVGASFGVAQ
jgi:tape measure domain-containing protein